MTQWRKCNRCGSIAPVYIPCPNCENASYTIGNPYFNTLPADIEKQLDIINGIPLDRLAQICEAERDNRCVVLPCKVGTKVYCTNAGKIKQDVVTMFSFDGHLWFMLENTGDVHWMIDRFGKTVFLTEREAAEAKGAV